MPKYRDDEASPIKQKPHRAESPNSRRVLTLRMLAAQTEWLEGPLRWQDGRIVWDHPRGAMIPTPADLSATQRALHQVARYPRASDRAFGDGGLWLEKRQASLEAAKRLSLLQAPDLLSLSTERSAETARRLVELLPAEAACLNALPASPSQALVRIAKEAPSLVTPHLQSAVVDTNAPRSGRALSALVLGAIAPNSHLAGAASDQWLARAHSYGTRSGVPAAPSWTVALLREDNGQQLLERWEVARHIEPLLVLPVEALRQMLFAGVEAECVVSLCESVAETEPLLAHLKHALLGGLDDLAAQLGVAEERLRPWLSELKARSREHIASLAAVAREGVLSTKDTDTPHSLTTFVTVMLDRQGELTTYIVGLPPAQKSRNAPLHNGRRSVPQGRPDLVWHYQTAPSRVGELLWEFCYLALKEGERLPASLLPAYWQLLAEHGATLLMPEPLVWGLKNRTPEDRLEYLQGQMRERWTANIPPLASLLKRSADPALCRLALQRGVHGSLGKTRFRDPALYGYVLQLTDFLEGNRYEWYPRELCAIVERFGTVNSAKTALSPLLNVVRDLPSSSRCSIFCEVMETVGSTRKGVRTTLPRLAPHLRTLFTFLTQANRLDDLFDSLEAVTGLEAILRPTLRQAPPSESIDEPEVAAWYETGEEHSLDEGEAEVEFEAEIDEWLRWLLAETQKVQQEREAKQRQSWFSLGLTTRLSAHFADGDFAAFQRHFSAIARTDLEDTRAVEEGLGLIHRYPALREVLAESLVSRPGRVLRLLARLDLTSRLQPRALQPLDLWTKGTLTEAPVEAATDHLPGEWNTVLTLAPELSSLSADYIEAQQLQSASTEVPAAVRRALELPFKLETELCHLEHLVAQPERSGRDHLLQRAVTLRARLVDRATLNTQAAQEAHEKLATLTREARLGAAEHSVENCFRAQLQGLVGRVPESMTLDEDWFNAVMLAAEITYNRKLVRHLLCAQAGGDLTWRDRLPGNIAFLRELEGRGANVEAWRGSHRKRYRCPELPGGWVHLCIEHDPLQIFQMGNAFGTCLSVGNMNAFSTVANACEANKRVIFARDGENRIVGRKLMAINGDGALVGFYTYVSSPNEETNVALRDIVARYANEFAERCGLSLADRGEVPTLVAEQWYDDGIVPWGDTQAKPPDSKLLEGRMPANA